MTTATRSFLGAIRVSFTKGCCGCGEKKGEPSSAPAVASSSAAQSRTEIVTT